MINGSGPRKIYKIKIYKVKYGLSQNPSLNLLQVGHAKCALIIRSDNEIQDPITDPLESQNKEME